MSDVTPARARAFLDTYRAPGTPMVTAKTALQAAAQYAEAFIAAHDRAEELEAEALSIRNLKVDKGEFSVHLTGGRARAVNAALLAIFKDNGGPNFFEYGLTDRETGEDYTFTIQRARGETPAQQRNQARAERDAALERVRELELTLLELDEEKKRVRELEAVLLEFARPENWQSDGCTFDPPIESPIVQSRMTPPQYLRRVIGIAPEETT